MQLVAAVQGQLEVLVAQDLVCAYGRDLEETRRTRERFEHSMTHRTPGGRKFRRWAAIAPTPGQPGRAGRREGKDHPRRQLQRWIAWDCDCHDNTTTLLTFTTTAPQ